MQAEIRRRLATAAQVLEFVQAHPDTDPGYVALVARLQERVARGGTYAIQQRDGSADETAASSQRREIRRLMMARLRHLARVASEALADHPDLQGAFALPNPSAAHMAFITAAKSMLATATAQQALLVGLGLGATFVDDFTKAVATFDAATQGTHVGRRDHVGARAELAAVAEDCIHLTRVLDGLNQTRFRADPELLAEWQSVSNVVTPSRRKKAPAPTPAPAQAQGPAPTPAAAAVAPPVTPPVASEVREVA